MSLWERTLTQYGYEVIGGTIAEKEGTFPDRMSARCVGGARTVKGTIENGAPQRHERSPICTEFVLYSFVEDEGGPLGTGRSGAGSKPVRAASVKSRGGERWIKSPRHDLGQVSVRKTSESEPSEDASLKSQVPS